jgi:hypothetical protein
MGQASTGEKVVIIERRGRCHQTCETLHLRARPWCLDLTVDARRLVRVPLFPRTRPPAPAVVLSCAHNGRPGTRRFMRPQRPPRHAARAVMALGRKDGDALLRAQRSDRCAGQAAATHGALRAANRAHPRRARGATALLLGTQKVSIATLFDAPRRRFRDEGTNTTTSSPPTRGYAMAR